MASVYFLFTMDLKSGIMIPGSIKKSINSCVMTSRFSKTANSACSEYVRKDIGRNVEWLVKFIISKDSAKNQSL